MTFLSTDLLVVGIGLLLGLAAPNAPAAPVAPLSLSSWSPDCLMGTLRTSDPEPMDPELFRPAELDLTADAPVDGSCLAARKSDLSLLAEESGLPGTSENILYLIFQFINDFEKHGRRDTTYILPSVRYSMVLSCLVYSKLWYCLLHYGNVLAGVGWSVLYNSTVWYTLVRTDLSGVLWELFWCKLYQP